MFTSERHRKLIRLIWEEGAMSRTELARKIGWRPNTVGDLVSNLLDDGILCEQGAKPSRGGRPRVPLDIDPQARHVLGLAIEPGRVSGARLTLRGSLTGDPVQVSTDEPGDVLPAASRVLSKLLDNRLLEVGISATGFVDESEQTMLFSSSIPGVRALSLTPLFKAASGYSVRIDNDMHALGAQWMLTHRTLTDTSILIVKIDDGSLGAAHLIDGRPAKGCLNSANELGHTRFFVKTEPCFCGMTGCLERICSTSFVQQVAAEMGSPDDRRLRDQIHAFDRDNPALATMLKYLGMGIANAVNLIRPHRLILTGDIMRHGPFLDELVGQIHAAVLPELVEHVRIAPWDRPASLAAEAGGWLALAGLYCEGWGCEPAVERA